MVRGEGSLLWDSQGKRYIDLFAGIAVSCLGYGHPTWVRAVQQQSAQLAHLSNYYFTEPNIRLAAALCHRTGFDRAFFCNSGTEAIEALLKLARRHFFSKGEDSRHTVVAFERAFHGRTMGALAATGQGAYRAGFGPLGPVVHVPYGDLAAVADKLTPEVAAVLVEPVQGEGGVRPAPPGFLAGLRALTRERGALLLADEIQTGVGRTGAFLACEHSNVEADAVALAKGLGGGFPIGAMLCREALAGALPPGSHGSTYGGNPLGSAAALAVLEVVEQEGLVARAAQLGGKLASRLSEMVKEHPRVVESQRGLGLLQALVLRPEVDGRGLLVALREAGILVTLAGGEALRFSPALNIPEALLDEALAKVDQVLRGIG